MKNKIKIISLLGKSPFNGKAYNDILSQNKNCNINFEKAEYKILRYDCKFIFFYVEKFKNLIKVWIY